MTVQVKNCKAYPACNHKIQFLIAMIIQNIIYKYRIVCFFKHMYDIHKNNDIYIQLQIHIIHICKKWEQTLNFIQQIGIILKNQTSLRWTVIARYCVFKSLCINHVSESAIIVVVIFSRGVYCVYSWTIKKDLQASTWHWSLITSQSFYGQNDSDG